MVPGALSTVSPCRTARPERGRTCASVPGGSATAMPVGISARAGREAERAICRHRGDQIEAGGERAVVGRQRKILAVRQAEYPDLVRGFGGDFFELKICRHQ